jgi:hypothetical protein
MILLDHPRTALALGVCHRLWNEHCAWEVHLSQTDEQKHRALSDDLVDALMYGAHEEILGILKKLEYLDGEAFSIVVRLICGDKKLRSLFQNRLVVVRWSAGKPKNLASTPHGEAYIISVLRMANRLGKSQKGMVASLMADFKVSRAVIMRAWAKRSK